MNFEGKEYNSYYGECPSHIQVKEFNEVLGKLICGKTDDVPLEDRVWRLVIQTYFFNQFHFIVDYQLFARHLNIYIS